MAIGRFEVARRAAVSDWRGQVRSSVVSFGHLSVGRPWGGLALAAVLRLTDLSFMVFDLIPMPIEASD